MVPIFSAFPPYTAVPSTLSLPIRLPVSLVSIDMCILPLLLRANGAASSSFLIVAAAVSVQHVERQAANFIAVLIGDEHRIVLVLEVRQPLDQAPRDLVGGVDRLDIVGKIGVAGID